MKEARIGKKKDMILLDRSHLSSNNATVFAFLVCITDFSKQQSEVRMLYTGRRSYNF